jgi:VCBS repeat-containing protein
VATINALGAGQSLVDTFTYVAQDAFGALSNTATVSLDVQGVNDTPVAHDDVLSPVQSLTNEDTSVQIASATLLANDTDVDNGHVLNVGSVSATSALGAAVSIDGNGVITYDPTVSGILAALGENEFANDSFVYTAVDEYGASSQATASLRIAGAYDAPTVQNNAPTVAGSLNGGTIYVWAGADVPDGDSGGPQFNLSPDALPAVVHALDNATDADHDPLSVESFAVVAGNKIGIWNDVGYFGGMNINSSQAISFDAGANTFALDPNAYALQGLRTGESATVTVAYNVSDGQAATPDSVSWTLVGTNDVSLVGMLIA